MTLVNIPPQGSTSERRALHAYLTVDSWETWQDFASDNGVSITGLLEAMGVLLANDIAENKSVGESGKHRPWVLLGRRIDALRRRRR